MRINKLLSSVGFASRRKVDQLIIEGRVKLNDQILNNPGVQVDPEIDTVSVDNKNIELKNIKKFLYFALNKPENVLSTCDDDFERQTVLDLIPIKDRIYPIGRLDYNSTGLILLTNDGDLALKLTHPRYHLSKTYELNIKGRVPNDKISQLESGIFIDGQRTLPAKAKLIYCDNRKTILHLTIYQGKKRQIRCMCSEIHLHLISLNRLSIGPIQLGNLPLGKYRELTEYEISTLKSLS